MKPPEVGEEFMVQKGRIGYYGIVSVYSCNGSKETWLEVANSDLRIVRAMLCVLV